MFELDDFTYGRLYHFREFVSDFKMLLRHFQSLTIGPKACFLERLS